MRLLAPQCPVCEPGRLIEAGPVNLVADMLKNPNAALRNVRKKLVCDRCGFKPPSTQQPDKSVELLTEATKPTRRQKKVARKQRVREAAVLTRFRDEIGGFVPMKGR